MLVQEKNNKSDVRSTRAALAQQGLADAANPEN